MQLNESARKYLGQYSANLATAFEIADSSKLFAVTGPKETKLKKALLDSAEFLKRISLMDVDHKSGQVINVGSTGLATGRKAGGRHTSSQDVDGHEYKLEETDSCAVVTWETLSVWANAGSAGEFMRLMNENATIRFALDMLRVGFNGKSVATTTKPAENPNGEDVNIGWHKWVLTDAPEQVITEPVYLDAAGGGDYKTLDAMAADIINTKIQPAYRNDPRLVVLVGADLVAYESARLYDEATTPSEKKHAQQLPYSIAGRPAIVPPFMPGKRMVVTLLSNLQILTQKGTRHRKEEHVEDRKQHENKYLRWEGYAVGDYDAYGAIDEAAVNFGTDPTPEA
ncbi:phage major capsid protein, P2 family [Enterovibrio nigricans]|uniref:Phage major capsid protein, P2 family n=1 Tax=Enterovibrio nigricans DSM 22720 TaxID=1121868 RepID=A0A1T4UF35_9GAMM|nr:phage major capsid protein, P2 family [Enterovibrio nigricans]PKF51114.1 phage major capsid protein, P2 family [Enterovibrio nigricans]SKA51216.1 phage major capsid protein, P2 family [Enterovibrio nigricans DSM 22720]